MTTTTQTVREFSMAGPCITVGKLVRETKQFFVCQPAYDWQAPREFRVGKRRGLVHATPCPSCRDHAATQYPNGYDN